MKEVVSIKLVMLTLALLLFQFSGVTALTKKQLQNIGMISVMGVFVVIVIICVSVYCYLSRKQAKEIDERLFKDVEDDTDY